MLSGRSVTTCLLLIFLTVKCNDAVSTQYQIPTREETTEQMYRNIMTYAKKLADESDSYDDDDDYNFDVESQYNVNDMGSANQDMARYFEKRGSAKTKMCSKKQMAQIQRILRDDVCKPRPTMVNVKVENQSGFKILPRHVTLPRCGGGAVDDQHGCLPIEPVFVNIAVTKIAISGEAKSFKQECVNIKMEKHIKCMIGCKLKASDCNDRQTYFPDECKCRCTNGDKHAECQSLGKMWRDVACSCECSPSSIKECSTGFEFDYNQCRCAALSKQPNEMESLLQYYQTRGNKREISKPEVYLQ